MKKSSLVLILRILPYQVTHRWYGEIQAVDFDKVILSSETLNFTQLVWRDSRELGVGKAVGKDGFSIVVSQYSPPGNNEEKAQQNIQKLCSPGKLYKTTFCLKTSSE